MVLIFGLKFSSLIARLILAFVFIISAFLFLSLTILLLLFRFFTVYGPYGRPDMSPLIFLKSVFNNKKKLNLQ